MSAGKLEVQIGADKTDFDKKIKEVEFDIKELSKIKLDRLKLGLDTTEINAQIKDAKNNLNQLKTTVKDTGNAIGKDLKTGTVNGGNALLQFSRIAQDAPFGIIGIGNNITATVESFGHLKNATGSTGGALKALGASLAGSGGILLGVSLLTTGLTYLAQSGLSFNDVLDKLTGSTDAYASALKKANETAYTNTGVVQAIEDVNSLRTEVDLAKQGFIDKSKVVEKYNETLGKTTGFVSSLDEVEKALVKNGDAYIQMTLLKAVATAAQEQAAKDMLAAEQANVKANKDFVGGLDFTLTALKNSILGNSAVTATVELYNKAEENRKEAIDDSTKSMNANLKIAEKFRKQAAELAKAFNFNYFGDNKQTKTKTFDTPQVSATPQLTPVKELFDVKLLQAYTGEVDKFGNKIKELPNTIKASLGLARQATGAELAALNVMWQEFGLRFSEILETSFENALIGFGETLGNALATGASVLESVGAFLLDSIGNTIKAVGIELVKMGILAQAYAAVVSFMKKAFANPVALAAAGVALVAIGAAISASAKRVGNGGTGGSGVSGGSGSGANNSSFTSSSFASRGSDGGTVVFEIAGQKLVGVLSNTLNANRRLGGQLGLG
jgi:hypothetical protein